MSGMSPSGSDATTFTDRKKATHLRCERQRREAINNGYNDLKELIPQTPSAMGCKTTNAAILFRACDYIQQLSTDADNGEKEIQQLNAQVAALEMIASQYEAMASEVPSSTSSSVQAKMVQVLLDDCFQLFGSQVDFQTYANITRTLLTWVEALANNTDQFQRTASKMVKLAFTDNTMR